MTATTPTFGFPYAQPADARGAGANAMRDLALAVEDYLETRLPLGKAAANGGASVALANNAWTNVSYTAADDGVLGYDGTNISYSGPARWFLVSFGANVGANGSQPQSGLRLMLSGVVAANLTHIGNMTHLGGAIPISLGAGTGREVVTLQAWANDGSGSLGGAHTDAWLRVQSLG